MLLFVWFALIPFTHSDSCLDSLFPSSFMRLVSQLLWAIYFVLLKGIFGTFTVLVLFPIPPPLSLLFSCWQKGTWRGNSLCQPSACASSAPKKRRSALVFIPTRQDFNWGALPAPSLVCYCGGSGTGWHAGRFSSILEVEVFAAEFPFPLLYITFSPM